MINETKEHFKEAERETYGGGLINNKMEEREAEIKGAARMANTDLQQFLVQGLS